MRKIVGMMVVATMVSGCARQKDYCERILEQWGKEKHSECVLAQIAVMGNVGSATPTVNVRIVP